jgi:hypothetical protein
LIGLLREPRAERHVGAAFLAIAFQRIAADRGAQKQQIVEMRQLALRPAAADVVNAGGRGAADFRQRASKVADARGGVRIQRPILAAPSIGDPTLSMWK